MALEVELVAQLVDQVVEVGWVAEADLVVEVVPAEQVVLVVAEVVQVAVLVVALVVEVALVVGLAVEAEREVVQEVAPLVEMLSSFGQQMKRGRQKVSMKSKLSRQLRREATLTGSA